MEVKRRSSLWFLLPIFFSIFGGIIAYFVIRDDDPKKARSCLLLGIILAAIPAVVLITTMIIGISLIPHFPMMHNLNYV